MLLGARSPRRNRLSESRRDGFRNETDRAQSSFPDSPKTKVYEAKIHLCYSLVRKAFPLSSCLRRLRIRGSSSLQDIQTPTNFQLETEGPGKKNSLLHRNLSP